MHPIVLAWLAALDRAGVRWCVLREATELDCVGKGIDLLVPAGDLRALRRVMAAGEEGFELRAWGHRPHHAFVSYEEETATWLKFDVVTELAFGPFRELPTRAAAALLGRTVRQGVLAHPAPPDAFWCCSATLCSTAASSAPSKGGNWRRSPARRGARRRPWAP